MEGTRCNSGLQLKHLPNEMEPDGNVLCMSVWCGEINESSQLLLACRVQAANSWLDRTSGRLANHSNVPVSRLL